MGDFSVVEGSMHLTGMRVRDTIKFIAVKGFGCVEKFYMQRRNRKRPTMDAIVFLDVYEMDFKKLNV